MLYRHTSLNCFTFHLLRLNARKTLLFHHEEPWVKKNREEDFEVSMGCHDGGEI